MHVLSMLNKYLYSYCLYRTWYVETMTSSNAKDIVILLDNSKSMHRKKILMLAKDAAKAAIGTLNARDRVQNFNNFQSLQSMITSSPSISLDKLTTFLILDAPLAFTGRISIFLLQSPDSSLD